MNNPLLDGVEGSGVVEEVVHSLLMGLDGEEKGDDVLSVKEVFCKEPMGEDVSGVQELNNSQAIVVYEQHAKDNLVMKKFSKEEVDAIV